MQALSQAAGNHGAHFAIMTGERYLTYLVKVQGSQDHILIHSAGSASGNIRNRLVYGVTKSFVFQGLKKSATSFEVDPTKILVHGNRTIKGKKSSGYLSHPDTISDPRTKQHERILHQLRPSTPIYAKENR